jgi:hypothetical protein
MYRLGKISQIVGSTLAVVLIFCASSAMAETITSPSYKINGNLGGNFGGQGASTNYSMTSIGGEAIVGNGSSGSYVIDQQQASATAQTMQLSVQPSGLVGYYPLDENTGTTTADASQYQNNGTLNATAAWNANGQIASSAVAINGATDSTGTGAVLVPDNPNLPTGSAMTIEAWVEPDGWYSNQAIASHWAYAPVTGGSGSWAFQTGTSNNLRAFISSGPGDTGENYVDTDSNSLGSTYWRHIAMVYDGTQPQANKVKIYMDGELMNTTVHGTLPSTLQNSSGDFSIGSFPGLGRALSGTIYHVNIFNRSLTQAEIKESANASGGGGVASGLASELSSTSGSTTLPFDTIVRTNATNYGLTVRQNAPLTNASTNTIPAISGSINSPVTWNEGVTKGYGFTLTGAPALNSKWNNGTKYAALPSSDTTFYSASGHVASVIDVISLGLRVDVDASQPVGSYKNVLTYTGTLIP